MTGWRHLYRIQRLIALRPFGRSPEQTEESADKPVSLSQILKTWLP